MTLATALVTLNVLVKSGAGLQLTSPTCEATILTLPAPVKVRLVPPAMLAGPLATAKLTASPLDAVAARPTWSVVTLSPMAGKSMVCPDGPMLNVPRASPWYITSATAPVTA